MHSYAGPLHIPFWEIGGQQDMLKGMSSLKVLTPLFIPQQHLATLLYLCQDDTSYRCSSLDDTVLNIDIRLMIDYPRNIYNNVWPTYPLRCLVTRGWLGYQCHRERGGTADTRQTLLFLPPKATPLFPPVLPSTDRSILKLLCFCQALCQVLHMLHMWFSVPSLPAQLREGAQAAQRSCAPFLTKYIGSC
jgi:hypothetical protein